MHKSLAFASQLLFRPSKAFDQLAESDAGLRPATIIYVIFLIAAAVFFACKPEDFPSPDAMQQWSLAVDQDQPHGLMFWAKVQSWGPFLTAVEVFCLAWFSWLLADAKDSPRGIFRNVKLIGAVLIALLPFVPILLYKYNIISKSVFGLLLTAIIAMMIPGVRARPLSSWKKLTSLSMSLNVVNLACLIPFTATVWARWEWGYHALELVVMVWTLGLGTYLLRRLEGMSSARAFMTLMLAVVFCPMMFVISAYMLGLVPRDVLKAMMTI